MPFTRRLGELRKLPGDSFQFLRGSILWLDVLGGVASGIIMESDC